MVLGYHVIFSAYGFWLPNDPRGPWSDFVGAWELFLAGGKATTTTEHRALHRDPHDRAKRLATKQRLDRPAVKFSGLERAKTCRTSRQSVVCMNQQTTCRTIFSPILTSSFSFSWRIDPARSTSCV